MPKFSVVIPTFNNRDLVGETVASALSQTYRDIEVVVDDNTSRDGTVDFLQSEYGSDNRLRIFANDEDLNIPLGWNRALGNASGEYVLLLHADNLLHPQYVELTLKALEDWRAKVAYSDCLYFEGATPSNLFSSPTESELPVDRLSPGPLAVSYIFRFQRMIPTSALTIHRSCLEDRLPYSPSYQWDPDMEQLTWLAERFPVIHVRHALAAIRTHDGQVASWKDPSFSKQYRELLDLEHRRGQTERHHFLIDWAASNEDVCQKLAENSAPAGRFLAYYWRWLRAEGAVTMHFELRFFRRFRRVARVLGTWLRSHSPFKRRGKLANAAS